MNTIPIVYILSDSIGETGEIVVKAAISQFGSGRVDIRRIPFLASEEQVDEVLSEVEAVGGIVVYTLVGSELKAYLETKLHTLNLVHVDIMGPLLSAFSKVTSLQPKNEPGIIRKVDKDYFNKVAAIEFAVKFDDGKDPRGLLRADLVLIGISRTSKTPLCMYLAHKGIKMANVPLVPDVTPPDELYHIPATKIVGLTIRPPLLLEIRKERLKTMGLSPSAEYASPERIFYEIDYALSVMRKIGCPIIDVTNKAMEETAAKLLDYYRKGAM